MMLCIGAQILRGRDIHVLVRFAVSVDSFCAEHAEGLYALITRDRGENGSRTEVIPLDLSGLDVGDMPHPPRPFYDGAPNAPPYLLTTVSEDATLDTANSRSGVVGPSVLASGSNNFNDTGSSISQNVNEAAT